MKKIVINEKVAINELENVNFNTLLELSAQDMIDIDGGGFPWKRVAALTAISPLIGVTYAAGYVVGRHNARNNGC